MRSVSELEVHSTLYSSSRTVVVRGVWKGQPVVVKRVAGDRSAARAGADLRAEFEILQHLRCDGVVRAVDLLELEDRPALLLEDVAARSLAELLRARRLRLDEALRIAIRSARTLGCIHKSNVVHKDLSPGNILVDERTGQVTIIDFDLASRFVSETPAVQHTDRIAGSLAYMSPEQTGRMNRSLDYRTDFYSFGALLYEMLTGAPPFRAADPIEMVHCHIARRPVPPDEVNPAVPPALSAVVLKLLAKTAEERYQSAAGLMHDLERCRAELERTGTIAPFPLGQEDGSDRIAISQKLYGRDENLRMVLEHFEAARNGASRALLILGMPGIGKSSLVHELYKPLAASHGWLAEGRCEQLFRDVPYRAFIQAFRSLVNQLLQQKSLGAWPETLSRELGANVGVIADVIPELLHVIGTPPPVPELDALGARHRFHLTFARFVGLFARREHPLVLFIDDLQWADDGSLALLRTLLEDPDSRHLLLIGAYRSSEVGPGHPLRTALAEAHRAMPVSEMHLADLALPEITRFVGETLGADAGRAAELAGLLKEKTGGNPFFLTQFLKRLHRDGLLRYDATTRHWGWDTAAIRARNITDNVVELLSERMRELDGQTREFLLLAGCMGHVFDIDALATISGRSPAEVERALGPALEAGLVHVTSAHDGGAPRWCFVHDRIQQAAAAQVPAAERTSIHLRIGRLLLRGTPVEARGERLFEIVEHLNSGRELLTEPSERKEVAELNVLAGRRAGASAAFRPAIQFWTAAVELLPATCWETDYELSYRLHMDLAEAAHAEGDFAEMGRHIDAVLAHAHTDLEKVPAYLLLIASHMVREVKYDVALRLGLEALRRIGIVLPEEPAAIEAETGRLMQATAARLSALSDDDLLNLPPMTDPTAQAAIAILLRIIPAVYVASPHLLPLVMTRQIALTLEHGLSSISPVAFGYYAMLFTPGAMEDLDACHRYGTLSLALQRKFGFNRYEAVTLFIAGVFLRHWKEHLREGLALISTAFDASVKTGNYEYWNYCLEALHYTILVRWRDLAESEEQFASYDAFRRKTDLKVNCQLFRQMGLNLMGRSSERTVLAGEDFDEVQAVQRWQDIQDYTNLFYFHLCKEILHYLYGNLGEAKRHSDAAEQAAASATGLIVYAEHRFFRCLCLVGMLGSAAEPERAAYRAEIERKLGELRRWARHCPGNFEHRVLLIEAELLAEEGGELARMTDLYDRSAASARANGFFLHAGLACERAGLRCLALGRRRFARSYFGDAHELYGRLGAHAKVAAMQEQHGAMIAAAARPGWVPVHTTDKTEPGVSTANSLELLDWYSILKSSQALSGEIVLERLLERLMKIVLENAGAERGVLARRRAGRLYVDAEGTALGQVVTFVGGRAVDEAADLALTVVAYCERTGRRVVLEDAGEDPRFRKDPYVAARRPRSVLCMPLIYQGQVTAVLYLENNLVAGSFTADRLGLLELLSSQLATSLENASLYSTLERRVAERTNELHGKNRELAEALTSLQRMQEQIIVQEKLSSLGSLTAGIAHEIRNPLTFVDNFSQSLLDLVRDLREQLESGHGDPSEVQALLGEIEQASQKIGEHSQRVERIVHSMLMHARGSASTPGPVEINPLLDNSIPLAAVGEKGARLVTFVKEYDEALAPVQANAQELSRVFINLINNACFAARARAERAEPGFEAEVRLTTRNIGDRVEVRVRDNGDGIPVALRDRIFSPFTTNKPAGQGVGLGLSLSYDIVVKRHRGGLRFETEEGRFTEFILELPR
ncbi:trifunctional serine/threonine-protein kinase/ATP-binding protein/sensor histidine kinase [Hyalangium gracile]|uniref:trifunctional serine/threonine-protein kinase/ATP-binding protein/sensor histidine kinase n=1 Tax=Hyalangium gracile TaxID=394092 RepID=UPI001CCF1A17|nr:ATP-binding sensor histidine kinase [Hyalangium gracile]